MSAQNPYLRSLAPATMYAAAAGKAKKQGKLKLEKQWQEAYFKWKEDPSKENTAMMLSLLDDTINDAIRSFAPDLINDPNLKARAKLLVYSALHTYDPYRGTLRSHVLITLRRLQRYAGQARQVIYTPEQLQIDLQRLNQAVNELETELGRPPTVAELSDYTGFSPERIAKLRAIARATPEGQAADIVSGGEGYVDPSIALSEEQSIPLAVEMVYYDSDDIDRLILERTLGLWGSEKKKNKDIAKELGISPAAVSQRLAKLQARIDEYEQVLSDTAMPLIPESTSTADTDDMSAIKRLGSYGNNWKPMFSIADTPSIGNPFDSDPLAKQTFSTDVFSSGAAQKAPNDIFAANPMQQTTGEKSKWQFQSNSLI